jgi:hypothetical protein
MTAPGRDEIQVQRNGFKVRRNEIQAKRNKIKVSVGTRLLIYQRVTVVVGDPWSSACQCEAGTTIPNVRTRYQQILFMARYFRGNFFRVSRARPGR